MEYESLGKNVSSSSMELPYLVELTGPLSKPEADDAHST